MNHRWAAPGLALLLCLGCGDDGGASPDTGSISLDGGPGTDGALPCTSAASCDDGEYCNGTETCTGGRCAPGAAVACDDGDPCTVDSCDESMRTCRVTGRDADLDGHAAIECGGDDCDDDAAMVYPGAAETCDAASVDEDCDPSTVGPRDADDDGAIDDTCCNLAPPGDPVCGTDCDDSRPGIHPIATETCNGFDDDCDGAIDDGVRLTFYRDVDGDGYGVPDMTVEDCGAPSGYALMGGDCDDAVRSTHPGAADGPPGACNGVDDDCAGAPDEGCECTEPASRPCGLMEVGACMDGVQPCSGGRWAACIGGVTPRPEVCTGTLDDDCDGETNEDCPCEAVRSMVGTLMFGIRTPDAIFNGLRFHFIGGDVDAGPRPAWAEIEVRCDLSGHLIRRFRRDVGDFEYFFHVNATGNYEYVLRVDSGHPDGTTLYVQITRAGS